MKPLVTDIDVSTGEVIAREMTDLEYEIYLRDQITNDESETL